MTNYDIVALIFISIFTLFAYNRGFLREGITFILWLPLMGSLIAFMYNAYDPSSFAGYEGVDRDTRGQMRTLSLIFLSAMIVVSILDRLFFKKIISRSSGLVQVLNGLGGASLALLRIAIFAVLLLTGYMVYSGTTEVVKDKSELLNKVIRPYSLSFYQDLLDRGYISENHVFEDDFNNPINKLRRSIDEGQESIVEDVPLVGEVNRHIRMEQYNKQMRNRILNGE